MPKKSFKEECLETLMTWGFHSALNPEDAVFEEEDLALLSVAIQQQRYCKSRIRRAPVSTIKWWEVAVYDEHYCPELFKAYFRMTRNFFWELHEEIKGDPLFTKFQDPVALQLAVSLYRFGSFGNASSFQHVATKFNVAEGTVYNYTNRVIQSLLHLSKRYIRWPSYEERKAIGENMANKLLPNCVGFVDGSDVEFSDSPTENKEVYWSRKKKYCMQMQIVCDHQKIIRDLFTGYPGSVHDAKVFSNSPIGLKPGNFFSDGEYLIGDSAYSSSETTIVPFRRNQVGLSQPQKLFNQHISSERVKVEHTIGILKNRFQSLNGVRIEVSANAGHRKVCEWILACAVLHNFLMNRDDWENEHVLPEVTTEEETNEVEENKRGHFQRQALFQIFLTMNTS